MGNWFEDHPTRSIIVYTFAVAAATWAISTFILDDRKVNLYKAQIEDVKAVADQYKAKTEILESENARLRELSQRYLQWLEGQPKSFPALETRIRLIEIEKNELLKKTSAQQIDKKGNIAAPTNHEQALYSFSKGLKKGEAFVDPFTGAILAVSDMTSDNEAKISLSLPGHKSQLIDKVRVGSSWEFVQPNGKFIIILSKLNWFNDSFEVQINQSSKK